jgi:hypothetical protein
MFKQFYERAKEANSAYSLATWIYKGLEFAFPTAVGGIVMWAASYRDWIWNDYGMFGLLVIGIIAALLTALTIFLSGLGITLFCNLAAAGDKSGSATAERSAAPGGAVKIEETADRDHVIPEATNQQAQPVSAEHILGRIPLLDFIIPRSRHDPKILWVDDAEIVGDRIAKVRPIPRNLFTQKTERRIGELGASCVALVVSDVSVHEAP